jgi:hypothetical protein
MRAICPAHISVLYFIKVTILHEEYVLWVEKRIYRSVGNATERPTCH